MQSSLGAFDTQPRTRLVFGVGSLARLGDLTHELGGTRVLLVTDRGLVQAGHVQHAVDVLTGCGHGIETAVFEGVHENPTTRDVDACVAVAREFQPDVIVGFGGGSSLDTAKGCNFIHTNGGRMSDYWGVNRASRPMLPLIAVPTTAGTGSECQSFALIADEDSHQKMACGDYRAAPRVALLDPELTLSQPDSVTAVTAIDALAHAVETAVTRRRTPYSLVFSREAFRLISGAIGAVLRDAGDLPARSAMLLGAAFAGTAIENSMLGAAHSCANPLTARFDAVHGHAVGMMLPHVIRFNGKDPEAAAGYADLCRAAGWTLDDPGAGAERIAALVEQTLAQARLDSGLGMLGAAEADLDQLAEEAGRQWTAQFNPRTVDAEALRGIYASALAA